MSEESDLALVTAFFVDERKCRVSRIPERPGVTKTPDLLIANADGKTVAHCEVKSPRDDWLDEQWAKAAPNQVIVGGSRNDPIFNRIGRNLIKAARQFVEFDPGNLAPAILVLVNHDDAASFADLIEVVTGKLPVEGGACISTQTVKPGWIKPALDRIDAIGWINARRPGRPLWFFTERDPAMLVAAMETLGVPGLRRL
jgi:hypothetical protein